MHWRMSEPLMSMKRTLFSHLAEEHPPGLRGVAGDDRARHAPCHPGDLDEPLAEALCLLARSTSRASSRSISRRRATTSSTSERTARSASTIPSLDTRSARLWPPARWTSECLSAEPALVSALLRTRVCGVRVCVCSGPYSAKLSRERSNTNIIAFGSRVVGPELAKMIVDEWLNATFQGGRHQHRIDMISEIEQTHHLKAAEPVAG